MMHRVGMYAASFDPIHVGHLDIIRRASRLFDILVVVVAQNPEKVGRYTFTLDERLDLVRAAVEEMTKQGGKGRGQVLFAHNSEKLTVKFAENYGHWNLGFPVRCFVRGVRNAADLDKEMAEFEYSQDICPEAEFVTLFCKPDLGKISSTAIKSLVRYDGGDEEARRYLPPSIYERVMSVLKGKA